MTDKKLKSITQNRNNLEEQLNELNEQLKLTKKRNERSEIHKKIDELKSMKDEAEEERKAPSREWWKMTNPINDENDKLTKINMGRKSLGKKKITNVIL
jgi:chromosome segregation ATPase